HAKAGAADDDACVRCGTFLDNPTTLRDCRQPNANHQSLHVSLLVGRTRCANEFRLSPVPNFLVEQLNRCRPRPPTISTTSCVLGPIPKLARSRRLLTHPTCSAHRAWRRSSISLLRSTKHEARSTEVDFDWLENSLTPIVRRPCIITPRGIDG